MNVASLHIYPLKSARAVDLSVSGFDQRGLLNDRRYLLVGESGGFLTQREIPDIAKLIAKPAADGLKLSFESSDIHSVRFKEFFSERLTIQVWRSTVQALLADQTTNDLISNWMRRPVKLVHMDKAAERYVNPRWVDEPAQVSFADGYPILVIGTASLDALNASLMETAQSADAALPMNRFRPNIVVETQQPWVEDTWRKIKIGDAEFDLVKPCDRCVVTTKDQLTGETQSNEPVKTLMNIRRSAHPDVSGPLFGIHCVPSNGERLSVGDTVEVIATEPGRWPLKSSLR